MAHLTFIKILFLFINHYNANKIFRISINQTKKKHITTLTTKVGTPSRIFDRHALEQKELKSFLNTKHIE